MRFGAPIAMALSAAALADLRARYGGQGDDTPVTPMDFDPPDGGFLIAYLDGVPAGCGGWRTLAEDETAAEIKRMFVLPDYRNKGVASALLAAIEDSAHTAGKQRTVLETGEGQPEAIALYEKSGYERIANFGYYKGFSGCRSYGRALR